jgi:hypothetical protein
MLAIRREDGVDVGHGALPRRDARSLRDRGIGRQIGVIGIAVGEMAEGREDESPSSRPTAQMT